jgi:predicted glycosyltransferase
LEGAVHRPTPQAIPPIDQRPALLFYCHDALRFGQSARAALVASLASHFRVAVLGDEHAIAGCAARRQALTDTYRRVDPAVVVIEQYPFGCRELSDEVALVLEAAAANPRTRLIACSVVETLVDLPFEAARRDDPVQRTADRYFDVVLVHADARLGRLEDAFEPHTLRVPILYTGFIATGRRDDFESAVLRPMVLVTCDSARPDPALFRAALSAYDQWLPRERLPMRIVAGPALPDRELAALQADAARRSGVIVERGADDLRVSASQIAVSISDGACDTVFEMLRANVPAVVVAGGWGDDERGEWSHRLAALGAVTLVEREQLTGAALAAAANATIVRPPLIDLNRAGGDETLRLLARLADPAGMFVHATVRAEAV